MGHPSALFSSRWFKVAVSAALLAVLVRQTDTSELQQALRGALPAWTLAAFVGYLASQTLSALRWEVMARPLGFTEPFGRFLIYFFAGMYLNLFGPSTVAGDVSRAIFLARGRRRALAATSVVAHRGIGLIALIWVAAAAVLALPQYPVPLPVYWAAWSTPLLTILAWLWAPRLAVRWLPKGHRLRAFVERDLRPYWHDRRLLAWCFVLAAAMHLLQVATQALLAIALGLRLPSSFFLIFVPIVNIVGMLPLTASGIGIREAGYWYFLHSVGVAREDALALGLLSSAVVLAAGLSGAPFLLLLGRRTIPPTDAGAERNESPDPRGG